MWEHNSWKCPALGNIHSPSICVHFQVFNSDYLVTNLVLWDILAPFGRNTLFWPFGFLSISCIFFCGARWGNFWRAQLIIPWQRTPSLNMLKMLKYRLHIQMTVAYVCDLYSSYFTPQTLNNDVQGQNLFLFWTLEIKNNIYMQFFKGNMLGEQIKQFSCS